MKVNKMKRFVRLEIIVFMKLLEIDGSGSYLHLMMAEA